MADLSTPRPPPRRPHGRPGWSAWLLAPAWLLAALGLTAIAALSWSWLPALLIGGIVLMLLVWLFVSILSPAVPDRTCPRCREQGLVKIRRGEPGVVCERCGFRDEDRHVLLGEVPP